MTDIRTHARRHRLLRVLAVFVLLAAAAAGFFWWRRPRPVRVVRPTPRLVTQSLAATGRVYGARETTLAPDQAGVLAAVLVEEGEAVRQGQLVAQLEAAVPQAELARTEAAVRTAEAQLREARAGPRASEVEQVRAETQAQVTEAEARLRWAEERLQELGAGGTSAQREAAAAEVREARARVAQAQREVARAAALAETNATARAPLEQARALLREAEMGVGRARLVLAEAERDLGRAERLYRAGALPRVQRDDAAAMVRTARQDLRLAQAQVQQAQVEVARQERLLQVTRTAELQRAEADLQAAREVQEAAQARLREVSQPARPEVLAQQRAEVAAARQALREIRAAARARLETITAGPRAEAVEVAALRLQEALRARDAAAAQLRHTAIRAPFAGVVTELLSRPGAAVGPGQPVLRLTQAQLPEVRVDLDERNLGLVRPGQPVVLTADAFPARRLNGKVVRIAPRADPQRGTVEVILRPLQTPPWLRPGLTVDANIIISRQTERLVVPTTAVLRRGDRALVRVVERGVVRERRVLVGEGGGGGVVVLAGVARNDAVVAESTAVAPGQRARPVAAGAGPRPRGGRR